jgi:hypothetical protein
MAKRRKAAEAVADDTAEVTTEPTELETPSAEQNPAAPIVQQIVDSTQLPPDATEFDPEKLESQSHAKREFTRRADPFPSHSYVFPDGYKITYQESDSRGTVEIQFGDGSKQDQPQNFEAIRPLLRENNMHWNGTNAWVADLIPPPRNRRESYAEKLDRTEENAKIRANVEDVVLPTVLTLEEEKRGQIELSEDTRQRINKATGHGR